MLRDGIKDFITGFQFLTRIPIVSQSEWSMESFGRSVKFFPIIGAIIGLLLFAFVYTVQKFGNSTYVDGQNARTGSTWSQQSQKLGNSTYTTGQDADGNSWNSTATKMGSTTIINGTDSDGDSFSTTCNEYGCY